MEASRMPQGILEAYRHQNLAMHGKDGTSATFGMNIKKDETEIQIWRQEIANIIYQDFRIKIPISRKI